MPGITEKVFSEVEVRKIGIKIEGAQKADVNECVGSMEEEMEVKTVSKKCRGVITKERTKATGRGTLKITLHMPQDMFADIRGMKQEGLKDGVIAYGTSSLHPIVTITAEVLDEDDNIKWKGYPNCSIRSALSRSVENGGEEVAEIELEVSVSPDAAGNGLYEAVDADLTDETLRQKWLEEFDPAMCKVAEA